MTKRELVDAYLAGKVPRRTFIRRLSALGVSAAAAVAYANVLASEARADAPNTLRRVLGKVPPQGKRGVANAIRMQKKHGRSNFHH